MINIYEPEISKYSKSAYKAIESGWISNHGEYIEKAENKLKEIFNIKHVILMSNGTCATHCLFLALKFKYPNINKIYVSNNNFIAPWNCCLMEYSIKQIEVMEMNINTFNINTDEDYIKSLDKNSAVIIVHNAGNIINVPRLKRIRPDIIFVEDNCEGLFGKYEDCYSGMSESSLCSSCSFYGNKIITSGEGGAFFTNNIEVYNYIKSIYSQGMTETRYLHDKLAYNYRMTNIQAAFLYDQLCDIENILENKNRIFRNYDKLLSKIKNVKLIEKEENTISASWIYPVRLIKKEKSIFEKMDFFKEKGIDIRPFFYPINKHLHLNTIKNEDINSEILNNEVIMIPSSPNITFKEQKQVVKIIEKFIKE